MSTYADKFQASADRKNDQRSGLAQFQAQFEFEFDTFQVQACRAVADGLNVLVAAPTGSGKTIVAEFAAFLCQQKGKRLFYTTPIKALSNQKFQEFRLSHGEDSVGLLTGDNSVNPQAPLIVMTTEVLRNMIYADDGELIDLDVVIMDEVHYLADKFRGAVWEETLIHLPEHVAVVALSATVSNAEEFGAWLQDIRGDVEIIVEEHRPVPLHQHVFHQGRLLDLFHNTHSGRQQRRPMINPEITSLKHRQRDIQKFQQQAGRRPRVSRTSRIEVIDSLHRESLLPAITFIFSRAGCDSAVDQCLSAGVRLTSASERLEIRGIVDDRCRVLPDEDLAVLGYLHWREALELGFAAHHAGMIPLFKETVEHLFQRGFLKMVFATETLALGINMPARTVVVERLVKWNGEGHVPVTAGEYTQLTGRAGRRGIDVEGHAVVMWHDDLEPGTLAGLASTRSYPLKSSFQPSYNMAVNLISKYGLEQARLLNEKSFAQFQADHASLGLVVAIADHDESAADLEPKIHCHLGDFNEYAAITEQLSSLEKSLAATARSTQAAEVGQALEGLRVGDVINVSRGRRAGTAVVIGIAKDSPPRVTVLGRDKQVRRVGIGDFSHPPTVLATLTVKQSFTPRSAHERKSLAGALAKFGAHQENIDVQRTGRAPDERITYLRKQLRAHPSHGCDERAAHMSAWSQRKRLLKERSVLAARRDSKRGLLTRQFDRLCEVLVDLGYLTAETEPAPTPAGMLLTDIYTELDLVTAEAMRTGVFDSLSSAELAGVCAALTYEARGTEQRATAISSAAIRQALLDLHRSWARVTAAEHAHGIKLMRQIDPGLVTAIFRWASGASLVQVLQLCELLPGDFVRWCRQTIDLLTHIGHSASVDSTLRQRALTASSLIDRDIVALSGVNG